MGEQGLTLRPVDLLPNNSHTTYAHYVLSPLPGSALILWLLQGSPTQVAKRAFGSMNLNRCRTPSTCQLNAIPVSIGLSQCMTAGNVLCRGIWCLRQSKQARAPSGACEALRRTRKPSPRLQWQIKPLAFGMLSESGTKTMWLGPMAGVPEGSVAWMHGWGARMVSCMDATPRI